MTDKEIDELKRDFIYCKLELAAKNKEVRELKEKINVLTMADMTHEYNQAEAEKFRPEYERQIKESFRKTLEFIDDRLSAMEDYTHGDDGKNITYLRKYIQKALDLLQKSKHE